MPFNFSKQYPDFLEFAHLEENARTKSLRAIFNRDIQENNEFKFRGKTIRPIKKEGQDEMEILFDHLTKESKEEEDDKGRRFKKRYFEAERARRLHWILPHINESVKDEVLIFSVEERNQQKRQDEIKTYIYNKTKSYLVVLLPQRSKQDYYLLTAFHVTLSGTLKNLEKKYKNRLQDIY
jgi:hypothetical protein